MNVNEFEVPVPWGHLAVKTWGDEKNTAVLVFHGMLDNAGAFDRLIPLLPKEFYYICVDLPGHGKSSHFPPFFPNYTVNHLFAYKYITDYFKRDKYVIIGHSFGGQIGFLFAKIYPELVDKLILLDTVHSYPVPVGTFNTTLRHNLEAVINIHEKVSKNEAPVYTYQEAFSKIKDNRRYGKINDEAAEALLKRAIRSVGDDKYVFTTDQRSKEIFNPLHDFRYIMENLYKRPVECPLLIILSTESIQQILYMKKFLEFLSEFDNVSLKQVDGDHDVHNSHPEIVSPHITDFLLENVKSKL